MYKPLFFLVVAFGFIATVTRAQVLDPYRRINDPLAIADLGGADSLPSYHLNFAGPDGPLDPDGFQILAGDTGAGVIRNLWAAFNDGHPPTTGRMRLWVDDSLLSDAQFDQMFVTPWGHIRAPFDTLVGGGYNMDVQIPYKRNFRWVSRDVWFFRSATWQRVDTNSLKLPSLGSQEYERNQEAAEARFVRQYSDPVGAEPIDQSIAAGETVELAHFTGPAVIDGISFDLSGMDTSVWQNLWIEAHWDDSPTPSVTLPLADFFGMRHGWHNIHALYLDVDSSRQLLRCSFPMPFRHSASLTLTNRSSIAGKLVGSISHHSIGWDQRFGYFGASHAFSRDIALRVLHPVLHLDGVGRYIGVMLEYEDDNFFVPAFLEGDIHILIDSVPVVNGGISSHNTGTEDYCNGGWYFLNTSFTHPFYGCPSWWNTMYRFHINEPYNFSRSIDVKLGHGFNDDFTVTMSSVAYYYKEWVPFYPSADTTVVGNTWKLRGVGYAPNEAIRVTLDSLPIFRGIADASGGFEASLTALSSWPRNALIAVNGVRRSTPIVTLRVPTLLFVQDTAGRTFSERDSIVVTAYGFQSHERLRLFVGDTPFDDPDITTDSDGIYRGKHFLPWVSQGRYRLNALRESGSTVRSDSTFFVSRDLNFEFEILPMVEGQGDYSYVAFPDKHYSQGAIRFCGGNWRTQSTFAFQFDVPFADSFNVTIFGATGNRYCAYRTYFDSVDRGVHDWFRPYPWGTISRDSVVIQNVYLAKGTHTIRFVTDSWHDSTVEYSIGPDNMHLSPLSATTQKDGASNSGTVRSDFSIYPNPVTSNSLTIAGLRSDDTVTDVGLYDILGKRLELVSVSPGEQLKIGLPPSIPEGCYRLLLHQKNGARSYQIVVLH